MDPSSPEPDRQVIRIKIFWYRRWISHYEMWVGATIMELKKKIEEDTAFGLAVEKQELLFNEQALEDQLRVEDYQIPSNATVSLFTKIRLSVVRDGVSHPFVAHNGMKVRDLINRLIAPHFGMLSSQVMLELNGEIITTDMVLRTSKFDGFELDFWSNSSLLRINSI